MSGADACSSDVRFPPIADISGIGPSRTMDQPFTAPQTRRELLARLRETLTSNHDLDALVGFLRDDLAFDPGNRSIVGMVLHEHEFDRWRDLMIGVRWDSPRPIDYDKDEVRSLSHKLLNEMERA
jgi:hypothetical protein